MAKHDRYFFDKRVMKQLFIKYGIMLLIAAPFLIAANILIGDSISFWGIIGIDVVIGIIIVLLCSVIVNAVKARNERKIEETKQRTKIIVRETKQEKTDVNKGQK